MEKIKTEGVHLLSTAATEIQKRDLMAGGQNSCHREIL